MVNFESLATSDLDCFSKNRFNATAWWYFTIKGVSITENPNFPLKIKESNIIELYDDCIVIRPKRVEDENDKKKLIKILATEHDSIS